MPLPANLGLRVPQASRNGFTKAGRDFKSLSRSAFAQCSTLEDRPAAICASDVRGRLLRSFRDLSAAALRSGFFLLDSWTSVDSSEVSNWAVMLDLRSSCGCRLHF